LGYMGEELEDIIATRELLKTAAPDEIGVSVSYPLPGTKFYEAVKAQLRDKTHWQESNDLDMMFSGTYTSEFYRGVRNLLHEQVDRQARGAEVKQLEQRWSELIGREALYRSVQDQMPMVGSFAS
jgi:anaerobic magnesium-protoporphyrin IX monomethyl ester cyclase